MSFDNSDSETNAATVAGVITILSREQELILSSEMDTSISRRPWNSS